MHSEVRIPGRHPRLQTLYIRPPLLLSCLPIRPIRPANSYRLRLDREPGFLVSGESQDVSLKEHKSNDRDDPKLSIIVVHNNILGLPTVRNPVVLG